MKTKICLIDSVPPNIGSTEAPLTLVTLASYLIHKKIVNKEDIKIISPANKNSLEEIALFKPDIIGISILTPFYENAHEIARYIKKRLKIPIIIGGYHISGFPQSLIQPFDIGVIGEGEETLSELIKVYSNYGYFNTHLLQNISGIVFRNYNDDIVITPARKLLDLNNIPPIKFDLLPEDKVVRHLTLPIENIHQTISFASIYTARGCPYRCIFCASQILWGKHQGFRIFDTEKVGDEIEYLYKKYHVDGIQIMDDTFSFSKQRLRDLIEQLRKRNLLGKIHFFNVFVRANLIDKEFGMLLKKFGTATVFLGMESGNQKVLNYLKRGSLKISDIKNAIEIFSNVKINMMGSFILFSPKETEADLKETLALAKWYMNNPYSYWLMFSIATPFPGTDLWDMGIKTGVIDLQNIKWNKFGQHFQDCLETDKTISDIFFTNGMTEKTLLKYWNQSQKLVQINRERSQNKQSWIITEAHTVHERNLLITKSRFKVRLQHFLHYPFPAIINLFNNPNKLLIIWNDFLYFTFHI